MLLNLLEATDLPDTTGIADTSKPLIDVLAEYGLMGGIVLAVVFVVWLGNRKGWFDRKPPAALLAVALGLFLTGCGSVEKDWIEADRATYDLVAPEYDAYVAGDSALTTLQKALRKSAIETWRIRLEAHEKGAK